MHKAYTLFNAITKSHLHAPSTQCVTQPAVLVPDEPQADSAHNTRGYQVANGTAAVVDGQCELEHHVEATAYAHSGKIQQPVAYGLRECCNVTIIQALLCNFGLVTIQICLRITLLLSKINLVLMQGTCTYIGETS